MRSTDVNVSTETKKINLLFFQVLCLLMLLAKPVAAQDHGIGIGLNC